MNILKFLPKNNNTTEGKLKKDTFLYRIRFIKTFTTDKRMFLL